MKKILALALALLMVLALAACGGKTEPAPSGSSAPATSGQEQTNTPDPNASEQTQTADPGTVTGGAGFEKYGLGGIIPADATDVVCARDEYGVMEYTFKMPVADKEAEQLAYQNHCLDTIRAGSDNGKAYKFTANWDTSANKMVTFYEEFVNYDALTDAGFGLIVNYYYNDRLLQIVVSDNGNDTAHAYDLFLSPSTNEELPEK